MLGIVDPTRGGEPAAAGQHGAPGDARGPDVAEDAALVADPVHQQRLGDQLVELGSVLLGDLLADLGDAGIRVGGLSTLTLHRGAHRPQEHIGQLEGVATGDVEAVEEPVPHEVEVARHRGPDVAAERAQRREHLAGIIVGLEELARRRVLR